MSRDPLVTSIADLDIAIGGRERPREDIALIAGAADQLGVGTVWVTEGVGRDAFSLLTELALRTTRIGLGTGIVNVFSRTPTALAQAAASLLELMGTRTFNLGLGTSGRGLVEDYHGIPFERPVTRMKETIGALDRVFTTGSLPVGGAEFRFGGLALGVPTDRARLRLYVAGLTEKTLEVTGTVADGWLPIWPSRRESGQQVGVIRKAATAANRPMPTVAGYLYGAVGTEPALAAHLRANLAWYVAANGTAYRRLFERYGYADEVDRICRLWTTGERERARRAVTDEMLADCTLLGEPAEVLRQAGAFRDAGVDRPVLRLPKQVPATDCVRMLTELAGVRQ
ncbi:LLM class flavin-dependent oxidoreductase [Amycolatopsis pithecellobii]|uniref:LLM class flavin-dependent oxidoreductase n=1 Tax=Amycolatopsis pithecellobii TaxID=664692 RepID=UPI0014077FD0|nr:LLM class flavin-dependent oxidoreductase [Amycolatopsis pithecellobii]